MPAWNVAGFGEGWIRQVAERKLREFLQPLTNRIERLEAERRNHQRELDELKCATSRRQAVPVGFHAMGVRIGRETRLAMPWETGATEWLEPGAVRTFSHTFECPTSVQFICAWGVATIIEASLGFWVLFCVSDHRDDGVVAIRGGRIARPGEQLIVRVKAAKP